jgi:hypothetical protein
MRILCQCAQFFAIDRNVVNLQVRGPLISEFKKTNSGTFESKYVIYREAHLESPERVALEFLKSLNLSGAGMLAIDPTYASKRFNEAYQAAQELLTRVGVANP